MKEQKKQWRKKQRSKTAKVQNSKGAKEKRNKRVKPQNSKISKQQENIKRVKHQKSERAIE